MTKAARNGVPSRREKRRQAILDAAREVFLEQGYGATSLNDIVSVSGGSLATLYDLFGGKAGLFQAMIEKGCLEFFEFLDAGDIEGKPPEEALQVIAERFFEGLIQQNGISLLRVIVAEIPQFPEIGVTYYQAGPAAGRERVSAYLAKLAARGQLTIDDPDIAASTFISMVLSDYQIKILCGEEVNLTPEEIRRHLDYVVSGFLKIYRPQGTERTRGARKT